MYDIPLLIAISHLVFTTLALPMLLLLSVKTGVWYPSVNPQSPREKNRPALVEIIRVRGKVPNLQEDHHSIRLEFAEEIEASGDEGIRQVAKSYDASSSTEEDFTNSLESFNQVEAMDSSKSSKWEHQKTRLVSLAGISGSFNDFASQEYALGDFRSLSYASRKGYPWLLFVIITLVTATFEFFCLLGLDVSDHTVAILVLDMIFWNLVSIVSLTLSAMVHYVVSFFAILLCITMSFTITIDLWISSTWLQWTKMLCESALLVILVLLISKSFVLEWILIWQLIIWVPIFVILEYSNR